MASPQTPRFELYGWNTPNGQKIVIALEEVGADYLYHPIDISKGEQYAPHFRTISPDGKVPALITNTHPAITHFESGAILLHLASLYPELNGKSDTERALVTSWTFWQVGQLGPLAGQYGRFSGAAVPNPQAVEHFEQLVWRCLDVLEKRLAESPYLAGDNFSVADIACLTWVASNKSYLQIYGFEWQTKCPSIMRWVNTLLQKPSVNHAFQSEPNK